MQRTARHVASFGLAVALLLGPATASADDTVVVLGLQSLEGDDDFALSLTGALRHAATGVTGWNVSDREVSLDQMSLAHSCDEPDAACLGRIAATLEATRIVYGTVRRVTSGSTHDYGIEIHVFDVPAGRIAESVSDTIPRIRSDIDNLRGRVRNYVQQLQGTTGSGTLVVGANVERAEVFVEGASVGFVTGGELRATLPAGDHEVEVRADGYASFSEHVTIADGGSASVDAVLERGTGGRTDTAGGGISRSLLGWAAIGLGGAGLVLGTISWLVLDGIGVLGVGLDLDLLGDDPDVTAYRYAVGPDVDDFCAEADADSTPPPTAAGGDYDLETVQGKCGTASTMTALYWTGMIVALVGVGAGLALILTDPGDEEQSSGGAELSLAPVIHEHGGMVSANLRF